jgi:hypothetical protein
LWFVEGIVADTPNVMCYKYCCSVLLPCAAALYRCAVPPQAALHRGLGELPAAIEVLRRYLDHFSNDRDAWEELADCYLEVCSCCYAQGGDVGGGGNGVEGGGRWK